MNSCGKTGQQKEELTINATPWESEEEGPTAEQPSSPHQTLYRQEENNDRQKWGTKAWVNFMRTRIDKKATNTNSLAIISSPEWATDHQAPHLAVVPSSASPPYHPVDDYAPDELRKRPKQLWRSITPGRSKNLQPWAMMVSAMSDGVLMFLTSRGATFSGESRSGTVFCVQLGPGNLQHLNPMGLIQFKI